MLSSGPLSVEEGEAEQPTGGEGGGEDGGGGAAADSGATPGSRRETYLESFSRWLRLPFGQHRHGPRVTTCALSEDHAPLGVERARVEAAGGVVRCGLRCD